MKHRFAVVAAIGATIALCSAGIHAAGHSGDKDFPGMVLEEGQTMADVGRGERLSRPAPLALEALQSDDQVSVELADMIVLKPVAVEPDVGVVFYHGAETDPRVYGRPLRALAEAGYLVVAVTMPRYLAVMAPDKADEVLAAFPGIESWTIIGHSMGGAMAAKYAYEHPDKVNGVLLWDAYPPRDVDLTDAVFVVGQIYRTGRDGEVPDNFRKAEHLLPDGALLTAIPDGEHTYFGDYILASHRPVPTTSLTVDEQLEVVVLATLGFLNIVEAQVN